MLVFSEIVRWWLKDRGNKNCETRRVCNHYTFQVIILYHYVVFSFNFNHCCRKWQQIGQKTLASCCPVFCIYLHLYLAVSHSLQRPGPSLCLTCVRACWCHCCSRLWPGSSRSGQPLSHVLGICRSSLGRRCTAPKCQCQLHTFTANKLSIIMKLISFYKKVLHMTFYICYEAILTSWEVKVS